MKTVFCIGGVVFGFLLISVFGALMGGAPAPQWFVVAYLALLFPANMITIVLGVFGIPLGKLGLFAIPVALSVPAFYGWLGFYIGGRRSG